MGRHGLHYLAQDRDRWQALVNVAMNEPVQPTEGKCLTGCGPGRFSGRTVLHGIGQWPVAVHLCRHILQTMRNFTKHLYQIYAVTTTITTTITSATTAST